MAKQKQEMNLMKLMERYNSDDACREILAALRWPDGVECPRCQSKAIRNSYTRDQYDCASCGYQFSVTSGTIFHDSHLPLQKWFIAIYLMIESKKGISANQMKRTLNVSYKTAWYLCHRIRAAMLTDEAKKLSGIVEIDETWVGGKKRGQGKGYVGNKTIAIGAVEREGDTVLQSLTRANKRALHKFIETHTAPDTEAIFTDQSPTYQVMDFGDIQHEAVNHKAEEWVRGDVHTNSIENVWSLFKRSVIGSYHQISEKHLDAYLDELEWRFNNRDNPYLFRDALIRLVRVENLPYQRLVG